MSGCTYQAVIKDIECVKPDIKQIGNGIQADCTVLQDLNNIRRVNNNCSSPLTIVDFNILKRHRLKHIRFHDLRGTAASLMAQHAKPKQLLEFMGHNKNSTLMEIYVMAFEDDRKAVAGFMDSILENSPLRSENYSD